MAVLRCSFRPGWNPEITLADLVDGIRSNPAGDLGAFPDDVVPALLPVALFARLAVIAQRHGKEPAELLGLLDSQA